MVNPKLVYCKFFASHHLKNRRDAEHRCCSRLKRLSTEGRMMLFGEFRIQGTQNRFRSVGRFYVFFPLTFVAFCFTEKKDLTFKLTEDEQFNMSVLGVCNVF